MVGVVSAGSVLLAWQIAKIRRERENHAGGLRPPGSDYYYGASPITYDTLLERVMEGDTLRAEVTSHRSAYVNTFTRTP